MRRVGLFHICRVKIAVIPWSQMCKQVKLGGAGLVEFVDRSFERARHSDSSLPYSTVTRVVFLFCWTGVTGKLGGEIRISSGRCFRAGDKRGIKRLRLNEVQFHTGIGAQPFAVNS